MLFSQDFSCTSDEPLAESLEEDSGHQPFKNDFLITHFLIFEKTIDLFLCERNQLILSRKQQNIPVDQFNVC